MGSSTREKLFHKTSVKSTSFPKTRNKVGKPKVKQPNLTKVTVNSKFIILPVQTFGLPSNNSPALFDRHLQLLSSKSDSQRRESLEYLTSTINACRNSSSLPRPINCIITRVQNLILDHESSIRTLLIQLLKALPSPDVRAYCMSSYCSIFLLIRAGMCHLSPEIRSSSLDILDWIISEAGDIVITTPGGWIKTLQHFLTLLHWNFYKSDEPHQNSANASVKLSGSANVKINSENKLTAKIIRILTRFLAAGFDDNDNLHWDLYKKDRQSLFPLHDGASMSTMPFLRGTSYSPPNPLNYARTKRLDGRYDQFDMLKDSVSLNQSAYSLILDSLPLLQRDERRAAFYSTVYRSIVNGANSCKLVGGEVGRAAADVEKLVLENMENFNANFNV